MFSSNTEKKKKVCVHKWWDRLCRKYQRIDPRQYINKHSIVTGYKANTQKLIAFLYTRNEIKIELYNLQ